MSNSSRKSANTRRAREEQRRRAEAARRRRNQVLLGAGGVLLAVLLVVVLVQRGSGSSAGAVTPLPAGEAAAFVSARAGQPGFEVIDVRTPAEFAQGHVQGATNIDVQDASFDRQIAALDRNGTYVVYCHSGRRSAIAADKLAAAGFTHVYDAGALADLQAAGVPTAA